MSFINGYKYNTEEEAINAQNAVDSYYGIPVDPTDTTTHWTDYYTADLNTPVFWYIYYHESLLVVLGQPSEFEVIFPPPLPPTE
jgi:hypothetical protein